MDIELDIVIPVYNEGANIVRVLDSLRAHVRTPFRVLICYDHDDDDTLTALRDAGVGDLDMRLVKNRGRGALGASSPGSRRAGLPRSWFFQRTTTITPRASMRWSTRFATAAMIVAASRFVPGGCMVGCPWLKATLVRSSAWALHALARVPTHDPSNGFRLFSREVLEAIPIESTSGFAYSIELLVKCHRLGWKIGEVPVSWYERKAGQSRFRVLRWLPQYLRWFFYAFATTYLRRGPDTVTLKVNAARQANVDP